MGKEDELIGWAGGTAQSRICYFVTFVRSRYTCRCLSRRRGRSPPSSPPYDDLIENNLRRIKILEEMAQSLYREWFVDFRFPGHENVKMVDSPLGMIPEGWELNPLGKQNRARIRKVHW